MLQRKKERKSLKSNGYTRKNNVKERKMHTSKKERKRMKRNKYTRKEQRKIK